MYNSGLSGSFDDYDLCLMLPNQVFYSKPIFCVAKSFDPNQILTIYFKPPFFHWADTHIRGIRLELESIKG